MNEGPLKSPNSSNGPNICRSRVGVRWARVGLVALILALPSTAFAVGSGAATAPATSPATAPATAPAYTKTTLHFLVHVGPSHATSCDVIGDLYLPNNANLLHRVPAILTTNGFGGSKNDQAGIGAAFAARDYAVLSYSGLGFGGSSCKITLDDPDFDGEAASQLISYLGGAPGIAFTDAAHTNAAPVLGAVIHDATDHAGQHDVHDPRVGMIGGSYGGGIQFATASLDPRLDTIVPIITWNDLSYSLDPNNAGQTTGLTTPTPGAVKLTWGLFLTADGISTGLTNVQVDPGREFPCLSFADWVCPALVSAGASGYFQPGDVATLRHASVATFLPKITIPTLLMQGENDTLFNLNEAVATYRALLAQHAPVKMVWQSWGHSGITPAPGELDLSHPDPGTQYETARILAWFDHYLKGKPVSTGPQFAYFQDWVQYSGIATPAYATSSAYPVGTAMHLYLSGSGALVSSPGAVTAGSQNMLTPAGGLPTSLSSLDAIGNYLGLPDANLPGTYASWQGQALTSNLDVVGEPTLTVQVQAPFAAATQGVGAAGELVVFAKIYDVGPDGKATLIHGLVAPVRVADVGKPIHIVLPAIVHRFAAGHHVEIMIAGGDVNYRGGLVPNLVTIPAGAGQVLSLPTVP